MYPQWEHQFADKFDGLPFDEGFCILIIAYVFIPGFIPSIRITTRRFKRLVPLLRDAFRNNTSITPRMARILASSTLISLPTHEFISNSALHDIVELGSSEFMVVAGIQFLDSLSSK
jgi:hypothetical protein